MRKSAGERKPPLPTGEVSKKGVCCMKDKTNGRAGATRIGRRVSSAAASLWLRVRAKALCAKGQGTTEYAILVGVLVVIAILAITVFRPKIQELWDAIASGINSL